MKESLSLRFLYGTFPGRVILKLLVHPTVSKAAGRFLSSGASKWIVPHYVHKHKINMNNIEIPPEGFSSFNEFFTRKRRKERFDAAPGHLISPCDGLMSLIKIKGTTVLDIKNTRFTLADLLKSHKLAEKFREGTALIFRLTPADYHRYCYAADGNILLHRKIRGKLHCVRPIALRTVPVFAQNSREYQVIKTKEFGTMVQMEVGALLVGKIQNSSSASPYGCVQKGEEKGYFEFGGSTIILLFQNHKIHVCNKLYNRQNGNGEIPVHKGELVAEAKSFR